MVESFIDTYYWHIQFTLLLVSVYISLRGLIDARPIPFVMAGFVSGLIVYMMLRAGGVLPL